MKRIVKGGSKFERLLHIWNYVSIDVIPWAVEEDVVRRLGRVETADAKLQLCPRAERIPRGSSQKRTTAGPRLTLGIEAVK